MKIGDLVRYRLWPHERLHESGMTGLVVSKPYVKSGCPIDIVTIDVMWNMDRGSSYPAGSVSWEYPDELEVVQSHE